METPGLCLCRYGSSSLVDENDAGRDVRWSKFVGTGKERNVSPFTKDLSLSHFFLFFLFFRMGLSSLFYIS